MNNKENNAAEIHVSVLLDETVNLLAAERGGIFVDATLGLGGHSEALLKKFADLQLVAVDQDAEALQIARKRLERFGARVKFFHGNFSQIAEVLRENKIGKVDGILADLGVSSLQLDSETRGFSFRFDAPLDMRMNSASGEPTVAELLEEISEFDLAKIIYEYGEERLSRRIARRIIERREQGRAVGTTKELADLIAGAVPRSKKDRIHPATRTFQALRIAVNCELDVLKTFLVDAIENLNENGRLAIISFHSLEDRIVKQSFQKMAGKCECPPNFPMCVCGARKRIEILTRKPIIPSEAEITHNPRASSAKLRGCLKLNDDDTTQSHHQ